jgi:hypothetical protein
LAAAQVAAVAWLAGQVAPRAARAAGAAAIWLAWPLALAAAAAGPGRLFDALALFNLGGPGGWPAAGWLIGGALAAALAARLAVAPALARRLWPPIVLHQALAWESAGLAALSGLGGETLASYRLAPGRRWGRPLGPGRGGAGGWGRAFARADFVALMRSPGRLAAGAAGLVWAGSAVAGGLAGDPSNPVHPGVFGAAAALMAYAALGPFSDGLRDWSADLRGPLTFGGPPPRLALARLVMPAVMGLALIGVGLAAGAAAWGGAAGASLAVFAFGALAWAAVGLGARLRDALRGALPGALLLPSPTPMGDPMPVIRVAWLVDVPLLCAVFGWFAAAAPHPGGTVGWTAAALALIALGLWRRGRSHLR